MYFLWRSVIKSAGGRELSDDLVSFWPLLAGGLISGILGFGATAEDVGSPPLSSFGFLFLPFCLPVSTVPAFGFTCHDRTVPLASSWPRSSTATMGTFRASRKA